MTVSARYLSLFFALAMECAAGEGVERSGSGAVVQFDGLMTDSSTARFAVSLKTPDGSLAGKAWLALGQKIGDYQLIAFDSKTELLSVLDDAGHVHVIQLPSSRVLSEGAAKPPSDLYLQSMTALQNFLERLRKEWADPVDFALDVDGERMPREVRARFLLAREKEEAAGGYLVGLFVNGEWHFSRLSASAAALNVRGSASDTERVQAEEGWALAMAEAERAHLNSERREWSAQYSALPVERSRTLTVPRCSRYRRTLVEQW